MTFRVTRAERASCETTSGSLPRPNHIWTCPKEVYVNPRQGISTSYLDSKHSPLPYLKKRRASQYETMSCNPSA